MSAEAMDKVKGPAIGLKATAALGALYCVASVVYTLFIAGAMVADGDEQAEMFAMMQGGVGVVFAVIGLGVAVFLWWAAGKMQTLEKYTVVLVASIVAMVPCISPCCIIGLPLGIWALIVLLKPEVKEAFTS